MNKEDRGLANSCHPYERGGTNYILKDDIIGETILRESWSPEVKLRSIQKLLRTVGGSDNLKRSLTSGLSMRDVQEMRTHISHILDIYDRASALLYDMRDYEDYNSFCSRIDSISIRSQEDINEDIEDEMRQVVKYYTEGVLPYLTPFGSVFEERDGIYKYWEELA